MTARQIRRAAERKARKAERKDEAALYRRAEESSKDEAALYRRTGTNRANAQLSTGPRTPEGKAISSQNALKTALTGRTVLLPTDDRARYEQHLTYYFRLWNPIGEHECTLVQLLADSWWRLLRIPQLEAALCAKGRDEGLTEVETWLKYEKQFRNLALQERRLSNYAIRLRAELEESKAQHETEEPVVDDIVPTIRQFGLSSEPAAGKEPTSGFDFSQVKRLSGQGAPNSGHPVRI